MTDPSALGAAAGSVRAVFQGPASIFRGRCVAFQVELQDNGGAPVPAPADLSVSLEGMGSQGAFYSDAACTAVLTSVTLPAGQTGSASAGIDLHFKSMAPASLSLAAAANGASALPFALNVNLPPATQLHWSGASATTTVGCAALTVGVQDQFGDPFVAASPIVVDLSDGVAPGEFYSDAACTVGASVATIAPGQSSAAVYYHQSSPGAATLHSSSAYAGPLAVADSLLTVTPAPPTQLAMTGSSTMTTISCSPFSIQTKDVSGAVANAVANVAITLSATDGGFFSNSGCSSAITSAQINSGTNSVTLYYQSPNSGTMILSAAATGLTAGGKTVTVADAPANNLSLAGPGSITTVACSPYVITAKDANNVVRAVTATTALSLSDGGAGGFFSLAANCSPASASATLAAGASAKTVYYKKTSPGPANLQADATGFSPGQLGVTATQGPAATLSISANPPDPITVLDCLAYSVTLQDAFGNVANAPANLSIALSGAGTSGQFYSNAACSATASAVSILSGGASANFYYKKTAPGSATLLATRSGMTTALRDVTVTAAPPSQVVFSAFTSPSSPNACKAFTAQLRDGANNVVNASAPLSFALSDGVSGAFYSNSGCTTPISALAIAAGQSSGTFYYKKATAGSVTISLALDPFATLSRAFLVSSGSPTKLVLGTAPSPVAQNTCNAFRIDAQDEQSLAANVAAATTVSFTGQGADGTLYSNSACTTPLAAITIAAGTSNSTFYYRKLSTGSITLAFTSPGLASVNKAVVVSSGVPTNLAYTAGAASIKLNTCSSYTVSSRDESNLVRPVAADKVISLADGAAGGAFHSNSTCTAAVTATTLAAGQSAKTVYYIRATTGAVTLSAATAGLTGGTKAVTVTTGSPSKIGVSSGSSSLSIGGCAPYGISLYDNGGNVVAATANTTIALSSAIGGLEIFSDDNCTSLAASLLVPSGVSTQLVFLKASTSGENGTLSATAAGLTAASFMLDTIP